MLQYIHIHPKQCLFF